MMPVIRSLRPKQWVKNIVIFAALIYSEKGLLGQWQAWTSAFSGFILFCLLSGAVYILNDLVDIEEDRNHPVKSLRPIASGELSIPKAKAAFLFIVITSFVLSGLFSTLFIISAAAYFIVNLAYSLKVKNIVILDVLFLAAGFVLRAQAGVGALRTVDAEIEMSHWLLLTTFTLAVFLALAKRRQEIFRFDRNARHIRKSLSDYSLHYIDEMTAIVATLTLVTYSLYTVSAETTQKFETDSMVYTVPLVLYGILRYLYLVHIKNLGDSPTEIFWSDRPMQLCIVLWLLAIVLIIHGPPPPFIFD